MLRVSFGCHFIVEGDHVHHWVPPTSCPQIPSDPCNPCFVDVANLPIVHASAAGLDGTIGGHVCWPECVSHQRDEDDSGQLNDGYDNTKLTPTHQKIAHCNQ